MKNFIFRKSAAVVLLLLISGALFSINAFAQADNNSEEKIYVVEKGDNLYSVARKFGVAFADLCAINGFPKDYSLKVGQKIKIPSNKGDRPLEKKTETPEKTAKSVDKGDRPLEKTNSEQEYKSNSTKKTDSAQRKYDTYTVQKGDTFWRIAKTNDITVDELKALNNLTTEATLKVGQKLKIPVTIVDTAKAELPDLSEADPRKYSAKKGDSSLEWPVKNPKVTYIDGKVSGVQLSAAKNEAVTAIRAGTVSFIGNYRGYGQVVFVQSKTGQIYAYCGLGSIKVQKGQYIVFGDTVGTSGYDSITGSSSIRFMVFQKNKNIDPATAPRG